MPASHPTWFDWITVAAIIVGPVLALFAQRALDWLRERKKARTELYYTLMSTRNQLYSQEHLRALNSIDIVFKDNEKIRAAWKAVLAQAADRVDQTDQNAVNAWGQRLLDLRVDLYQIIGQELGYENTTDYILRGIYSPQLIAEVEQEWHKVRKGFVQALQEGHLSVRIAENDPGQQ